MLQSIYPDDSIDGHAHFIWTQSFDPQSAMLVVRKRVGTHGDPVEGWSQLQKEFAVLGHLQGIKGVQHAVRLDVQARELVLRAIGGKRLVECGWNGRLMPVVIVDIALATLRVIDAFHARRVAHLGLNPTRLALLNSGADPSPQMAVSGFGEAMMPGIEPRRVDARMSLMQLAYTAPEQAGPSTAGIDRRADFYSLGVVLYQLASGRLPFNAPDPVGMIQAHATTTPSPVHHVNAAIPLVLSQVISRMIRREPDRRYDSAREAAEELASIRPLLESCEDESARRTFAVAAAPSDDDDDDFVEVASAALQAFDSARHLQAAEEAMVSALRNADRHQDSMARRALEGIGRLITAVRHPEFRDELLPRLPADDPAATLSVTAALDVFYRGLHAVIHDDEAALAESLHLFVRAKPLLNAPYMAAMLQFIHCMGLHARANVSLREGIDDHGELGRLLELESVQLAHHAGSLPESFLHLQALVDGLRAALDKRSWEATQHFDAAIAGARRHARRWQLAVVMAHAGRFCIEGQLQFGGTELLASAHDLFSRWGLGDSRCRALQVPYPFLSNSRPRESSIAAAPNALRTAPPPPRQPPEEAPPPISPEPELAELVSHMLEAIEHMTGATSLAIMFNDDRHGWLIAGARCDGERIPGLPLPLSAASGMGIPESIVRYALAAERPETVANAAVDPRFTEDPALNRSRVSALLILPIMALRKQRALLLLENDQRAGGFAAVDMDSVGAMTRMLSSSIDNALAFRRLEQRMAKRNRELENASSQLQLRERALAHANHGVMICAAEGRDTPIVYVNDMFVTITGYSPDEVIGRDARFLQGDDRMQAGSFLLSRAIEDRRAVQGVVIRNYRKDGREFFNEVSIAPFSDQRGVVTHFVGSLTDVTGRLGEQLGERRKADRLAAVFELSPDGFVVIDEESKVTLVNPAFERMTGLQAADLVGASLATFEARLATRLAVGELPVELESDVVATGPAETPRPVPRRAVDKRGLIQLVSPQPRILLRRERRGESPGRETVITFRDVTQEVEIDQMKSDFLSMAAHELRTPMTTILGFAELAIKRKLDDDKRMDMLQTIHRQAQTQTHLINDLLDLARIEARRGSDFDYAIQPLAPIVEETAAEIHISGDRRKPRIEPSDEVYYVNVDRGKIARVIANLLTNALKYSLAKAGSKVTIRYATRDNAARGRRDVGVQVVDQGIGMSSAHVARMFDRFFRADTSNRVQGTGLGMTIAKEIVDIHDGEIVAESELGRGTTMTMWLPLHEPR